MKNKLAVTVGASACGLFAGLLLASGGVKVGSVRSGRSGWSMRVGLVDAVSEARR